MTLGKCPYCNDGAIEVRDKEVNGKKVKLYACRPVTLKFGRTHLQDMENGSHIKR